jgi:hypothetical protein
MYNKLARSPNPFASGSYKKAYVTIPTNEQSPRWIFDVIPNANPIITTTVIDNPSQLYTAFIELLWTNAFNLVDLAPKIYAVAIENQILFNSYYIYDGTNTLSDAYNDVINQFGLLQPLTLYVLVESCNTQKIGENIGPDKNIKDEHELLQHVNALIEKLVYHETLFMDFKAANICIQNTSTYPKFMCLDFDPQFIITFSEMGLPIEDAKKASKTFMLVMFVGLFVKSSGYGRTFKNDIQQVVRQSYLAKYDIMAMLNTFIKLEQTALKLCLMPKNPLTMLFHYFENPQQSDTNGVHYCQDIKQVTYTNGLPALQSLYNTLYNLVCGGENHSDWLTKPIVYADITTYKNTYSKINLPAYVRPLFAQTGSMFTQQDMLQPSFSQPPAPAEHDPTMLNEKPSFSPNFGENIAKSVLGKRLFTNKNGGRKKRRRNPNKTLRKRRNAFRIKKNIV